MVLIRYIEGTDTLPGIRDLYVATRLVKVAKLFRDGVARDMDEAFPAPLTAREIMERKLKRRKLEDGSTETLTENPEENPGTPAPVPPETFSPEYIAAKTQQEDMHFIRMVVSRDVGFFRPDAFDEDSCHRFGVYAVFGWEIMLGQEDGRNKTVAHDMMLGRWNHEKCFTAVNTLAEGLGFLEVWGLIQGSELYTWNSQVLEHQSCEFRKCWRPPGNRISSDAYDIDDPEKAAAYRDLLAEFAGKPLKDHTRARKDLSQKLKSRLFSQRDSLSKSK